MNKPLYICYSFEQMSFLSKEKKIQWEVVGLNPTTKNKFWVFIRNDYLNDSLNEWKNKK